ncbi:SDR family NAD(P)-dependent oxidoreductase [Rhizobium leguminosarum]|uniref:SDR family NAD(P)-dependent oxidoreductase n=1 Tax=Rhizobium leguminosarum TaxID=384 RepID=UPI001FEF64F0|nr:SDR family NAD(P)-dependent oxidoreductase [Rhizobium leguminosarum]
MHIELLGQLHQRLLTSDGGERYLRLESRAVVPARSSCHGISCSRHLSRSQAEIPLILAVQFSRASSGLVNSAGITGPVKPTIEYDFGEWKDVVDVCLTGTFNCCRHVVPVMLKRDYGRIVNISSVAGKEGNPNIAAYSAAKAGVLGFTKSLGKELAKTGIAVNAVTPTTAKTPILDGLTSEFIEYMRVRIPRDRFVELHEIASMVVWLLSEENSFTTASTFDLSGGRTTY